MAKDKSAAQKQREYRARRDSDPRRRAVYLKKQRAVWAKKKAVKKWLPLASLSEHDKRVRRRKNREAQATYRHRVASARTVPIMPLSSTEDDYTKFVNESR